MIPSLFYLLLRGFLRLFRSGEGTTAEADLRRGFAAWVRKVALSAVAREMGLNNKILDERLRGYEGRRG